MIDRNNPHIDVDELMARIREEVRKRENGYPASGQVELAFSGAEFDTSSIDALLRTAQAKAEVRTKWSGKLNFFPFKSNGLLQRISLKVLAFLFQDQRHVNFSVIQAFRETLELNRQMHRRMVSLELEVQRLENRLDSLDGGSPEH